MCKAAESALPASHGFHRLMLRRATFRLTVTHRCGFTDQVILAKRVYVMRNLLIAVILAVFASALATAAEPATAQSPAPGTASAVDCAAKAVSCRALQNCAQACAFLRQCGVTKLDRDKDGIPCESLCTAACDTRG